MPELLFHGAAGEVTGSMHMVRHNDRWLALDCGLFQGKRSDSEEKNRQWPMDPKQISAVILSHAHIDHTGRVPKLVRDGYDGPIFCTPATRDLCALMLADSAHIQEEDAEYMNKKLRKKNQPLIEPLYVYENVLSAMGMMQTISYNRDFHVLPGVKARFIEAGHMLGSAGVLLTFVEGDARKTLYFTGDVGRPDKPILRDPAPMPECDAMICESTYGARITPAVAIAETEMLDVVSRTIKRGGRVVIPAFSVGRTQTIVYYLHQEMIAKNLPRIRIYVDSPLATNATDVFRMHPECYDAEARAFHLVTGDILGGRCCTYTRSVDESKALQASREPCVVISASGMCEAGRIRHHLKSVIGDERNTIMIVGFQAAHTLGRRLVEGLKQVNIFGEPYNVKADVVQIHGFSGHADQADLLEMLKPHANRTKDMFLVHGEPDQSSVLKQKLTEIGFARVDAVQRGTQAKF